MRNLFFGFLFCALMLTLPSEAGNPPYPLELSRPVRPWEFLSSTGTRAGLFGNEAGRFEAWVYPLKVLREFHLRLHWDGLDIPAESLARTVTVHPESVSILYAGATFAVRETLFVPVHESGAVILIDIDTTGPLEVEAIFQRDFQLEWPAAFGGSYTYWDPNLKAFVFAEELKRFTAIVGSPTGDEPVGESWAGYSAAPESSFRLGKTAKGHESRVVVIAASPRDAAEAEATYRRLSTSYAALLRDSADYYRTYLDRTVHLTLPDEQMQAAYDWARVSMIQGLVDSPFLGTGLVAGYRTSGDSQRPGFAWFFGRDALWTALALDAAGDFSTTRTALDFLIKYQREDGKIPHEVSQSASFTPWFKDYPYPYASADATPLFLIAMNDYVTQSGDIALAREKWSAVWKAYQFLRSTYDARGFPQNIGFGHGWIEGGPLLPVKTELYQSGLGIEALRSLSNLANLVDKKDVSTDLLQQFSRQQGLLNQAFWSPDKRTFAYALDQDDKTMDAVSVLATVPMWFGLLDEPKAEMTIDQLAGSDQQTDWGMRIISSRHPNYDPSGYHYGSVWPLFTGWAATGEYRYHRTFPAYSNLRANALLTMDGSLGHVTEVLSGDYNLPLLGSSPHQIWSAAMVVNPLLRGLFGLEVDAPAKSLKLAPHLPATWTAFQIENLHVGQVALDLDYTRTPNAMSLSVQRTKGDSCSLEFSPALSLRAQVLSAEINGRTVPFRVQANAVDQHVTVRIPVSDHEEKLNIRLRNDFGLSVKQELPRLGESSQGLRVLSESWTRDRNQMTLEVDGIPGNQYEVAVWNPGQIVSIEGAQMVMDHSLVRFQIPEHASSHRIVFRFRSGHAN